MPAHPDGQAPSPTPTLGPAAGVRLPSLRASLYALVWVCVLPTVGLAAYLAVANYRLERERVYAQSLMLAR
ncbi:hypothetical protein [Tepidimonas fonticaldi]|uniref:hypothetical protein n=1 Tax=Tepidimonas fonticaldi TaxID=1101373 RepID=UPI0012E92D48|nr:hypothetical protein [Tepidimonas fonticaldi]